MFNFLKQQKASKVGKVVGYIFNLFSQAGIPLILMNTILLIPTAAGALQERGVGVTVWEIGVAVFVVTTGYCLFYWKFIMPNFYAAWTEQFYKHGSNPMTEDINIIKEKLDEIKEKVK
jgi:hypothetical protein